MWHKILFRKTCTVDFLKKSNARLERLKIRKGEMVEAQVRPHLEAGVPPDHSADIIFSDGCMLLAVPYDYFRFQ